MPSKYGNISSWRKSLIKLTHYDETKKRAHDSQIVGAKENLKLSHGGSSYSPFGLNGFKYDMIHTKILCVGPNMAGQFSLE